MNKMEIFAGAKKVLVGAIILVTVATSGMTMTGCTRINEGKEIARSTITIQDEAYTVRDIYLVTNRKNPEESSLCTREHVGYSDSYDMYVQTTGNVYVYRDVKTGEEIALSSGMNRFTSEAKEKYTAEELAALKNLPRGHIKVTELYKKISYEDAVSNGFELTETNIAGNLSVRSK